MFRKMVITCSVSFIFYIAAGFWAIPFFLQYLVEERLADCLDAKVNIDSLGFNPFTLEILFSGLDFYPANDSGQFLHVKELLVDFSSESFARSAFVISSLHVEGMHLKIVRNEDYSWNVEGILACLGSMSFPDFSISNIVISESVMDFMDIPETKALFAEHMEMGIPFLANMAYVDTVTVAPYFSGMVNGEPLVFGILKQHYLESNDNSVNLYVNGFDLFRYRDDISRLLGGLVDLRKGVLDLFFNISFDVSDVHVPVLGIRGVVQLHDLVFAMPGHDRGLEIERLKTDIADFSLLEDSLHISNVEIIRPVIIAGVMDRFSEDWPGLLDQMYRFWSEDIINIDRISVADGQVVFSGNGQSGSGGASGKNDESLVLTLDGEITGLSSSRDNEAMYHVELVSNHNEEGSFRGALVPRDLRMIGVADIRHVGSSTLNYLYGDGLSDFIYVSSVDVAGDYEIGVRNEKPVAIISNVNVLASDLAIRDAACNDVVKFGSVRFVNAGVDSGTGRISADSIEMGSGRIRLTGYGGDRINFGKLAFPEGPGNIVSGINGLFSVEKWNAYFNRLSIFDTDVEFLDKSSMAQAEIMFNDIELTARNVSIDSGISAAFNIAGHVNNTGNIRADGKIMLPDRLSMHVDVKALPVQEIQSFLPVNSSIYITGGNLYVKGGVNMSEPLSRHSSLSFMGDADLHGLSARSIFTGDEVIDCARMAGRSIRFSTGDGKYVVSRVIITDFYNRVERLPNGRLDFPRLLDWQPPVAENVYGVNHRNSRKAPSIMVKTAILKNGRMDFSDSAISPVFRVTLSEMDGVLRNQSNMKNVNESSIDISARVGDDARLEVEGELNLLSRNMSGNIIIKGNEIPLSLFEPYSVRYLGHGVSDGHFSIDIRCFIEDDKVSVEEKVYLYQFVPGPAAGNGASSAVPLGLAVDLMEDRDGVIYLDIPLNGGLDDPGFSIIASSWEKAAGILRRNAGSPFDFLSETLGLDYDLDHIGFLPGSVRIAPGYETGIEELADALRQRPNITVGLYGVWNASYDVPVLENRRFDFMLKKAKLEDMHDDAGREVSVQDVEILPEEYARYVEKVYKDADFDKPRNFIGFLKSQPVDVMERMIRENIRIDRKELEDLADRRAAAVKKRLVDMGISSGRILLPAPGTGSVTVTNGFSGVIVRIVPDKDV